MRTTQIDSEKRYKSFPITSVCRQDLENEGFDTSNVDDADMRELASKLADAYMNCFWDDLHIIAEEYLKIPRQKR